jgi:mono/diheme cytochrome c family protein
VFIDRMVMPRIAFPLQDGVILALETDNRDLFKYTDTDGDGVADRKELFYSGFGRVTNMEWQPGGLTWALDNWLYSTYNPFRLRIAPDGKVLREETDPNGGQWWSAQDNYGKVWWVDGGGETGPVNFQTPIVYGAFNVPDNFEPDFQIPWPAAGGIADMQGGMRRVRMPDGTLNHFTAASGAEIYRGHRLPADMQGDLLFGEPVGRIVRQANVVVTEGLTQLRNAYPQSEFVRSTDPLFRPVAIHNAPDGTLYLVDMYTGIIQDAQFVGPGSYLRRKIEQYGLDEQHNNGRIWRIRYDGMPPDRTRPRMYDETAAGLVAHLAHPSGWWRDTAQKLLVLRQDKSVVPALRLMAQPSAPSGPASAASSGGVSGAGVNQLARIHALWTLEGLGALEPALVRTFMKDADPQIRIQAIRASESLYKAGDRSFAEDYRAMVKDADPEVVIQAMLTLNLHKVPNAADLIRVASANSTARGVREIGTQLLTPRGNTSQGQRPSLADTGAGPVNLSTEERRALLRGESAYRELCFTCHGVDGKGAPMPGAPDGALQAPPLAGSPRVVSHREYIVKTLLHGMTGPMDGRTYGAGVMVPMGANTDEWIADVASYVRVSFGNSADLITPAQVGAIRSASANRKTPWTLAELEASVPTLLTNAADWRLTASHNPTAAGNAVNGSGAVRWDSGGPLQPGMWFQIELPAATRLAEVQIDSAVPGARGGRGAVPAGPPVAYSLQLSTDGTTWSGPVAAGAGAPTTIISFAPADARFIRITQTGTPTGNTAWAIQRVRVYRAGSAAATGNR